MEASIEKQISAYIELGKIDKIAALVQGRKPGQKQIDWNLEDEFGQPLALRIIESGDISAIQCVLQSIPKSDLSNMRDENQCSALHFAVLSGSEDAVSLIIKQSPDLVTSKDSQGCLPIHWASKHGYTDMLPILGSKQINETDLTSAHWASLHYAASSNKQEACKWLLENGATPDLKDSFGRTARELAEERSYSSIVALFP